MGAGFPMIAETLWIVLCTITVVISFWMVQRNLRQALRGMAYEPTPLWIDRLEYGLRWLMFPLACYQMVLFLQSQDFRHLWAVVILLVCVLVGRAAKPRDPKKVGAVVRN
jgi:hypothetical protein